MATRHYTISLPPSVGRRVARAARKQKRDLSDVAAEAIVWYFSAAALPTEAATPAEMRAIRRGEAAFQKGDSITLNNYLRPVGNRSRRTRKKV